LPGVRELATLVDEPQVASFIHRTMFPSTPYGARSNDWYWASHAARSNASAARGLDFADGFTGFNAGASGVLELLDRRVGEVRAVTSARWGRGGVRDRDRGVGGRGVARWAVLAHCDGVRDGRGRRGGGRGRGKRKRQGRERGSGSGGSGSGGSGSAGD
jgi:hypothetical protein